MDDTYCYYFLIFFLIVACALSSPRVFACFSTWSSPVSEFPTLYIALPPFLSPFCVLLLVLHFLLLSVGAYLWCDSVLLIGIPFKQRTEGFPLFSLLYCK